MQGSKAEVARAWNVQILEIGKHICMREYSKEKGLDLRMGGSDREGPFLIMEKEGSQSPGRFFLRQCHGLTLQEQAG